MISTKFNFTVKYIKHFKTPLRLSKSLSPYQPKYTFLILNFRYKQLIMKIDIHDNLHWQWVYMYSRNRLELTYIST